MQGLVKGDTARMLCQITEPNNLRGKLTYSEPREVSACFSVILETPTQEFSASESDIPYFSGTFEGKYVPERYKYDPYGKRYVMTAGFVGLDESEIGQEYGYTGRRHDSESGMMYFRARYYSGELGRFVSRDPLGTALDPEMMNHFSWLEAGSSYRDGMSLYAGYFAMWSGVDPSGMDCKEEDTICKKTGGYHFKGYKPPKSGHSAKSIVDSIHSKLYVCSCKVKCQDWQLFGTKTTITICGKTFCLWFDESYRVKNGGEYFRHKVAFEYMSLDNNFYYNRYKKACKKACAI